MWLQSLGVTATQHTIILPNNKRAVVDGFDASTTTVYEFLGDFWHGHPSWWTKFNGINDRNGVRFEELFEQTEKRLQQLYSLGYNIIYVWETDINAGITQRYFTGKLEC